MLIVTSEVLFWTPFDERKAPSILARLDAQDSFGPRGTQRYCTSKLLNALWTRALAEKVSKDDVVINCVNPGLCSTALHRDNTAFEAFLINTLAWSAERGAYTLTDGITRHANTQGAYLSEQRVTSYVLSISSLLFTIFSQRE